MAKRRSCLRCQTSFIDGTKCGCYPRDNDPQTADEMQERMRAARLAFSSQHPAVDERELAAMAAERRRFYD